jgi:A/G-specific adenine glycosylase
MTKIFFDELINWSQDQYSHLPWRSKRTLYRTLVSEIMLQQTTVGTVLNHFEIFLSKYPAINDLAVASEEQVCISWKGLGYYRRARNLRNIAIQIVEKFDGEIPVDLEALMKLKGIGPYTANAIVAIGADKRGLAVDANLERVLARFYGYNEPKGVKLQQKIFKDFYDGRILPEIEKFGSRKLNEAFMDLGRVVCQARKASCSICPMKTKCVAHASENPLQFPTEVNKQKNEIFYIKLLRILVRDKRKYLFYQKKENEWLAGQWELPTFILQTNDEKLKQYPRIKLKKQFEEAPVLKTGITKYSIDNHMVEMSLEEFRNLTSSQSSEYIFKIHNEKLNISTTSIKILKKMA